MNRPPTPSPSVSTLETWASEQRVGGERQELEEVGWERPLLEQRARLLQAMPGEGLLARLFAEVRHLDLDGLAGLRGGDRLPRRERDAVRHPLPDLRPRDLGR